VSCVLEGLQLPDQGDRGSRPEKLALLYALVRAQCPKLIIETGTYRGASAVVMAAACRDNAYGGLITTDPSRHGQEGLLADNDLDGWAIVLHAEGEQLMRANHGFDFAFIDCAWNTRYPTFELAVERVRPGGMIVVDDVLHPNWRKADKRGLERILELTTVLPVFHGLGILTRARE